MELRHLRYAVAVADVLHFTRAAEKLGIGQPPLSQQIKLLEDEIGARLFYRKTRGVELTPAGEAFMPHARAALQEAEQGIVAAQRAARGEAGSILIGFTGTASFNPVVLAAISCFRQRFPDVTITLVEDVSTRLLARLRANTIDVAFLRPEAGAMPGLLSRRIASEPIYAALPRTHPLAGREHIDLIELGSDPFVMYPRTNGSLLYDAITSACVRAGFSPLVAQEAPQMTAVINLVAIGVGVALVPASMSRVWPHEVCYVALSDAEALVDLNLVHSATGATPPATRNFLSCVSTPD